MPDGQVVQNQLASILATKATALDIQSQAVATANAAVSQLKQLQQDIANGKITTGDILRDYAILCHRLDGQAGNNDLVRIDQHHQGLLAVQSKLTDKKGQMIAVICSRSGQHVEAYCDPGPNRMGDHQEYELEVGILDGEHLVLTQGHLHFPTGGRYQRYEKGWEHRENDVEWEKNDLPVGHYPHLKLEPPSDLRPELFCCSTLLTSKGFCFLLAGDDKVQEWLTQAIGFKEAFAKMQTNFSVLFPELPLPSAPPAE